MSSDEQQNIIEGTEFYDSKTLDEKEEPLRRRADEEETEQIEFIPSLPSGRIPRQPLPRTSVPRNPLPRQGIPRRPLPDNKVPRESLPRNRIPRRNLERSQIERNPLPRNRVPRNPLPRTRITDERREWEEELDRERNQ